MSTTHPNTLELFGDHLKRYLEIRRLKQELDPAGQGRCVAWTAKLQAMNRAETVGPAPSCSDGLGITPQSLEAYARRVLGDPGPTPWLTPDQWEIVILFCHEGIGPQEAARRLHLSLEGVRFRWNRTKRRIKRLPEIGAVVNVHRRELYLGA